MRPHRVKDPRLRGYGRLVVGILLLYAVIIGTGGTLVGVLVRLFVLGLLLVVVMRIGRRRGRWIGWPVVLTGVTILTALLTYLAGPSNRVVSAVGALLNVLLAAAVIGAIVREVVRAAVVDLATVLAVLCTYLLLALFFGSIQQAGGALQVGYLDGVVGMPDDADTLYFSVITLTTVGYGDVTPGTALARAVAVLEALVGQLYLVSVVAGVVAGWRRAD